MKNLIIGCLWLFAAVLCCAQTLAAESSFSKGEEMLMQNQPAKALPFLESAVSEDPANTKAWLFLGIVFEQLDRTEDAIAAYKSILPRAGDLSANVAANLGNVYFRAGNTETAEQYFSQALSLDAAFSAAYLGRANTRIKSGNLQNAVKDYEQYLSLEPRSPQRANIEQLVALIRSEAAAEERRKALAAEEERRLAEERQKLLDSVSSSLQSAADYSQGLSSGRENVEGYEGEFELE